MRLAAPEQQPMGNNFDICQYGCTGSSIAGHHLKKSIGKRGNGSMDHKRQSRNSRNQNPSKNSNENAVLYV